MNSLMAFTPLVIFATLAFQPVRIDLKQKILPNRLVAKLSAAVLATCLCFSALVSDWTRFTSAARFGFGYLMVFFGLYLLSRGQLGFGDVKFAFPCGLVIGWTASSNFIESLLVIFGCAAFVSLLLLLTRKIDLRTHIAFGPFMYCGVLITCLMPVFSG